MWANHGRPRLALERIAVLQARKPCYEFPAATASDRNPSSRVYVYAGNNYSNPIELSLTYRAAGIWGDNISATPVTLTDGTVGINVSWALVEGAAYYKVYRSRQYVALGNGHINFHQQILFWLYIKTERFRPMAHIIRTLLSIQKRSRVRKGTSVVECVDVCCRWTAGSYWRSR